MRARRRRPMAAAYLCRRGSGGGGGPRLLKRARWPPADGRRLLVQAGQRRARRHALLEARQLVAEERLDGALIEDRAVGALAQRDAVLVTAAAGPLEVVQQDGLGSVALGLEAFDLA